MASLSTLIADNTAMKSIPSSIFRLKNLNYLSPYGLKWPLSTNPLPRSISGLNTLRVVSLAGCNLTDDAIPMELVSLNFLEHLDVQRNSFCPTESQWYFKA
ncbi:hypothetical protein C1H46_032654 [Malus baccata]|uniref:Leucine-rich repeat-containing N-terminal plant-type domain-containing protein n=1 Tax=Malus baccata TaxID=106549 RepID=A0A540L5N8_MALBA|nr:hypothetical protein C1H46_032654 [Malus baccata]